MKLRYWCIGCTGVLYYLISCQSDPYEPREDVVECRLPGGALFTVKSAYQGEKNSWGNLLGGHAAPRLNQRDFDVYYQSSIEQAILVRKAGVNYRTFKDDPTGQALCARFGEKNGVPYVSGFPTFYFPKNERKFLAISWEDKLSPSGLPKETSNAEERQLRQRLRDERISTGIAIATQHHQRVVWETSLMKDEGVCMRASDRRSVCPISSVFKYVSLDGGRTWQAPEVTSQSEIFELGRSLYEQSFIARPVRINGKEVVPRASPAPQPESQTASPPAVKVVNPER